MHEDASCFAILNPATGVCRTNVFAGQFVWDIGDQITDPEHDNACEDFPHGFLYEGQPYNPAIYGATGQIFPVNSYDVHGTLEVWWYVASRGTDDGNTQNGNYAPGIFWPHKTALYQPEWPVTPYKIVVARRVGGEITEGTPRVYDTHASLYHTGGFSATLGVLDSDQETIPGWNPNDEHAVILPVAGGYRVFAARDDFPWTTLTNYSGHPYVLVQFPTAGDGANPTAWGMDVFQVLAEDVGVDNDLDYTDLVNQADPTETVPLVAGMPLSPVLFPINYGAPECFVPNLIPPDPLTYSVGDAVWLDRKGGAWVIEAEHDGFVQNPLPDPEGNSALGTPSVSDVYLWENWGPDGGCQPWLSFRSGLSTVPEPIRFRPQWPLVPPACAFPNDALCARPLKIGQSVDQSGQCGTIQVLHDSVGQRIIDPTRWVGVTVGDQVAMGNIALNDFQNLPPHLYAGEIGGGGEFPDRIRWNFNASGKLEFRGIMSDADQYYLDQISNNVSYLSAIAALYAASRSQLIAPEEDAAAKFVTVGDAAAIPGWITVAFQNDQACVDAGLPVSVEVWRVDCPPFTGSIRVIQPECLFSEKLAMQFSGDLGGDPDQVTFHWQYSLDYDPAQPELAQWDDYFPSNSLPPTMQAGTGLREVLIEGASLFTLQDSWWRVRYRGYAGCPGDGNPLPQGVAWPNFIANDGTEPSLFTEPQLAEGWVKRVVRQLTPFDQRFSDFHETPVNTIVDMIAQAGIRYEQNVALNCDPNNLDAIGLIEAYSTVMNRAKSFSAAASVDGVNQAIELVASKVSDLYMLLGNEAYADAMDPTLGVFAGGGEAPAGYNPLAAFSFQDQLPSLLEEELALLRGVSDTRAPDKNADNQTIATVYNRIPWNFTSGVGQVAYANNYQLTNVTQALQTYPQGHGDAWGHYLQATKLFYKLLGDSTFTWITESESVLVAGQPVEVGFMYERKFAEAAAAKPALVPPLPR
ncbi:MAG: hypothetical protein IPK83_20910 [Planctomycetes bacterium]|nr:hypothetical protein [Planctomycetota bacterium]